MEITLAIILAVVCCVTPTILSALFGILTPILFATLGYILGVESIIVGIGGSLGSILNYWIASQYIKKHGAMSGAPALSKIASSFFLLAFVGVLISREILGFEPSSVNYLAVVPAIIIISAILTSMLSKLRIQSVNSFVDSVSEFKIVEKYQDGLPWAIYLHFKDGKEGWNQTIKGSWCARDPQNDLTFVFKTKEEALKYAKSTFSNANHIE